MYDLSWLNPTPHAIAVYASQPLSPAATQHSLPSGRYSLLGPDLHRLDRTSLRLAHLLNHLVGDGEHPWRHIDAERSRVFSQSPTTALALLRDADEPSEAFGVGAQPTRFAVVSDAALVQNHRGARVFGAHAAVLFHQDDRKRAFLVQPGEHGSQCLNEDRR